MITDQTRAELAEKCIHQIEDYLEYRYNFRDAEDSRRVIMDTIEVYAQDLVTEVEKDERN